ncbi:hypothetical protein AMTRI_Chr05g60260 [Amborella trichopoda]
MVVTTILLVDLYSSLLLHFLITGSWVSLCFLTGTCGLFEVTGVLGTSFSIYRALMKGRKLSLISLDVNFIDDTFYICFLPDLRGVRVAPSLVSTNSYGLGMGTLGVLFENWMQSERWFDLCLLF